MNKRTIRIVLALLATVLLAAGLTSCNSKADTVSHNLSKAADNFQVERVIVFYNGITGQVVQTIEGKCSLGNDDPSSSVSVTCQVGVNQYTKDILHLSDNMSFYELQENGVAVSDYHKTVNFRPGAIIPNVNYQ